MIKLNIMEIEELKNIVMLSVDELNSFVNNIGNDNLLWGSNRPKGGQQVAMVLSDITLTHIPTGITVEANEYRSMHLNRNLAVLKLIMKLNEK